MLETDESASRRLSAKASAESEITSKSKKTSTKTKTSSTDAGNGIRATVCFNCDEKNRIKATFRIKKKERREGHMKDALALGGEEGRDKLR